MLGFLFPGCVNFGKIYEYLKKYISIVKSWLKSTSKQEILIMWYKIIFNCKSKDGAKTLIPSWDYRFDFCGHIFGKTLCFTATFHGEIQSNGLTSIYLRGILVLICDECKLMVYNSICPM